MPTFSIDTEIRIRVWDYQIDAETEAEAIKKATEELKDYYDLGVYGMPHNVETGYEIREMYVDELAD